VVVALLRQQSEQSASEVAAVGLHPATLRRWETGRGWPEPAVVSRPERHFGMTAGELTRLPPNR
jgi:hypothetical protein